MARVPITELIFRGYNPVRTAATRQVFILNRDGSEAAVFPAEGNSGESEIEEVGLPQPLTTNAAGLPTGPNGEQVWVEEGSYTLAIGEDRSPIEAVKGASAILGNETVETTKIKNGAVTAPK